MLFVTLLNHIYWVTGAAFGALLGYAVHFDTKGIEFVMTALFLVMFIDQWEKTKNHKPALIGLGCSTIWLAVFGSGSFLLPSMACIILCLLAGKKENTKETKEQEQ